MTKPIHDSLKRVLDASNQSMEDIATLLGVSISTVLRWSKYGISQVAANKLGKILSLDPTWILTGKKSEPKQKNKPQPITKEAYLEFVETTDGLFVLREVGSDEPWVSIDFSDKIKEMLGQETLHTMGHHMIQAGIASFMQKQMSQYHAHVFDETPPHFS